MISELIVFLKNPVPGAVKTRLLSRYTPEQAAAIYGAFIRDTLENARSVDVDRCRVAYAPAEASAEVRDVCGPDWQLSVQPDSPDLGDRMSILASEAFEGGAQRVVIIGSDIPSLPSEHIRQAFHLLRSRDVVLGPSSDGGYYLVGLSCPAPRLFEGVEWSTHRVFGQTLEQIRSGGFTLGLVPPWYDVDTPEELDILIAHAEALERSGLPFRLRHTRACLHTLT